MQRSIAKGVFLAFVFNPLIAAQQQLTTSTASSTCLANAEAANLALRWLQIFQTNKDGVGTGASLTPSTLAVNFTYFDEGASFGASGPLYTSRAEVTAVVSGSGYSGGLVTDVKYSVLHTFASCNEILVRWGSESVSAKNAKVTVPVGTAIEYKGTDYLQVDLNTRLIYNATSSSDLLNYYIDLGDDVIKTHEKM